MLRRLGDLNPGRARTLTALAVPFRAFNRAEGEPGQANLRRLEPVCDGRRRNREKGCPVYIELAMRQQNGPPLRGHHSPRRPVLRAPGLNEATGTLTGESPGP